MCNYIHVAAIDYPITHQQICHVIYNNMVYMIELLLDIMISEPIY